MKNFFMLLKGKVWSLISRADSSSQETERTNIATNHSAIPPSNNTTEQDPAEVLKAVKEHISGNPLYDNKGLPNGGFAKIDSINDKVDDTPLLSWAIIKGDNQLALKLIKAGADLNAMDLDRHTPLHEASKRNNTKVIEALKEKGADQTIKVQNYGPEHSGLAGDLIPKADRKKSAMRGMFEGAVETFKSSFSSPKPKRWDSRDDGRF
jgi:ankyrin repeat protein